MLWPPRVAVVTGANRGLGLSLAECLAESGTHVVLAARDEQREGRQPVRIGALGDEGFREYKKTSKPRPMT